LDKTQCPFPLIYTSLVPTLFALYNLRLVQEDLAADLKGVSEEALVPLRNPEALQRKIAQLKAEGLAIRGKRRYLQLRLESLQSDVPSATPATEAMDEAGPSSSAVVIAAEPAVVSIVDLTPEDQPSSSSPLVGAVPAPAPAAAADLPSRPGFECPVCLRGIEGDINLLTGCGHAFCVDCVAKLLETRNHGSCAVCRARFGPKTVIRVAAAGAAGTGGGGDAGGVWAGECDPEGAALVGVTIQGQWSIKVIHAFFFNISSEFII
jgi:hypothetical protein